MRAGGGVDPLMATPLLPTRLLVGVDGAWWLPWSSKPVRPDFVWLGGFDSHTLPPGWLALDSYVSRPDHHVVHRRAALLLRLASFVAVIALSSPLEALAQERDSVRVDTTRIDTARVGTAAAPAAPRRVLPVDTIPGPPISPGRAFFTSLLVPGLGQSQLDRPVAGMLFVTVEAISILMIQKSQKELAFAKRVADIGEPCGGESPPEQLCLDTGDPDRNIPPTSNRYSGGRLTARRQHVEDWVALLIANHLLAGAEAYVAAHLWDLPARIGVRPTDRGVAVAASLAW